MNDKIPCFSCTAKCCKHYDVFIDHIDIKNLSDQLGNFSFLKKLEYKRTFGYVPKFKLYDSGKKKNWVICLENPNRVCTFLKNDFCTIYPDRPIICKIYPLYYDRGKVKEMKNLCPVKWQRDPSLIERIEVDYKQLLLNFLKFETICDSWNKIVKKEDKLENFLIFVKNFELNSILQ
jgi:Fe-S-cluster containining protein